MGMMTPMVIKATRENSSVPNQSVKSGTQAMGGTGLMTSKRGLKTARNVRLQPMAMPKGTPTNTENMSAVSTRRMDIQTWYIIVCLATSPDHTVTRRLSASPGVGRSVRPRRRHRLPKQQERSNEQPRTDVIKQLVDAAAPFQSFLSLVHFFGLHFKTALSIRPMMPEEIKPRMPMTMMPASIIETSPKERPICIMLPSPLRMRAFPRQLSCPRRCPSSSSDRQISSALPTVSLSCERR